MKADISGWLRDLKERIPDETWTDLERLDEAATEIERLRGVVASFYDLDSYLAEQAGALEVMPGLNDD